MNTILVGGCFDLIHIGHIYFLEKAKRLGDKLVVLLESDETIKRIKGDHRPIHTQEQRKKMLLAIRFVDEVISIPPLKTDEEYFNLIQKFHPDIIAVTEGDPILEKKQKQAELIGATAVIIPRIPNISTTSLAKALEVE
ncbi:MAG: glycerol-3-phosphate cytidyltransferase TagD [uncultured bacterium]|nr:MAG: glycerol-3-phosphate cytidyltransferase TagD [uncultured bacterium]